MVGLLQLPEVGVVVFVIGVCFDKDVQLLNEDGNDNFESIFKKNYFEVERDLTWELGLRLVITLQILWLSFFFFIVTSCE